MVGAPVFLAMPRPVVELPWGSASMTRTWRSLAARDAPRLMAVVVFPTPPFWLATAITLPKVWGLLAWRDQHAITVSRGTSCWGLDVPAVSEVLRSRAAAAEQNRAEVGAA